MNRSPDCCCGYRYPGNVECPACIAVIHKEAFEAGRAEATAEIVAFLRHEARQQLKDLGALSDDIGIRACAEAIEAGEHIKADGGS